MRFRLFPGITGNDDGAKAYSHRTFAQQLAHWQHIIDSGTRLTSQSP